MKTITKKRESSKKNKTKINAYHKKEKNKTNSLLYGNYFAIAPNNENGIQD